MALKKFFKWGVPLLFSAALLSCGGGGGGGGSSSSNTTTVNNTTTTETVNGQVLSSYVKGIFVCLPDNSVCVQTDDYGKFSINVPYGTGYLRLNLPTTDGDYYGVGTFNVTSDNITVYPYMLTDNNATLGALLRTFLHALGGDFNNTVLFLNLSGVEIENVTSSSGNLITNETIADLIVKQQTAVVNAILTNGTRVKLQLNPQNNTISICNLNGCKSVNATAYNWLVLIYMMADNNLSSYADLNIKQLQNVTYTPSIKVIALEDTQGPYGIYLYENLPNGTFALTKVLPEDNTANATYLAQFVKNTISQNPAQHVALIIWDHGLGWLSGFYTPTYTGLKLAGSDETSNSYLYMHQLREALKELKNEGFNLDVIGFDECLMATLEVFYDVSVNSKYVVASEYFEPATGWNYTDVIGSLSANPYMDGWEFAKTIVDSYRRTYTTYSFLCQGGICTLTAVPTNTVLSLVDDVNSLANYYLLNINSNSSLYDTFLTARNMTAPLDNTTTIADNLIDLYQFAFYLNGTLPITVPANIMNKIENSTYSFSTVGNLHGISIYFPLSPLDDGGWAEAYYNCTPSSPCVLTDDPNYYNPFATTTWAQFIADFVNR